MTLILAVICEKIIKFHQNGCRLHYLLLFSIKEEGEFKHQKAQKNFSSSSWESNLQPSEL